MKNALIFIAGLLLAACAGPAYFEGEIVYRLSISPDTTRVNNVLLKPFYGEQWRLHFKEGNMRWDMAGNYWLRNFYLPGENKLYYLPKASAVVSWKRAAKPTDETTSIQVMADQEVILGHRCDLLVIESRLIRNGYKRKRRYYYSADLPANPDWFARCQDGNLNEVYGRMKALPLRIVDQFETFSITYEAVRVQNRKLPDDTFRIDARLTRLEVD